MTKILSGYNRTYNIVQTTGNRKPGGANVGFWSMAKFSILFFVKREDRAPTASGMAMQVIRFFYSIFIKISILLFTISLTLIIYDSRV